MWVLLNTFFSSFVKFIDVSLFRFIKESSRFVVLSSLIIQQSMFCDSSSLAYCSVIVISFWLVKEFSKLFMKIIIVFALFNSEIINPVQLFCSLLVGIHCWIGWNSILNLVFNIGIDRLFEFKDFELIVLVRFIKVLFEIGCVLIIKLRRRNMESIVPITHVSICF